LYLLIFICAIDFVNNFYLFNAEEQPLYILTKPVNVTVLVNFHNGSEYIAAMPCFVNFQIILNGIFHWAQKV